MSKHGDHGFAGDVCPVCGASRASLKPGGANYGKACVKPLAASTRHAGYDSFASSDEVNNVASAKDRRLDDDGINVPD